MKKIKRELLFILTIIILKAYRIKSIQIKKRIKNQLTNWEIIKKYKPN